MSKSLSITKSNDGSNTIYNSDLDEHYHSTHGAFNEAMHVFIEAGLQQKIDKQQSIKLLEMGLGTGLNAVLTAIESSNHWTKVFYYGLEAYPLENNILESLQYEDQWGERGESLFNMIHSAPWNQSIQLFENFILRKIDLSFEEFNTEDRFDLIYWDAFGPRVQAELWTSEVFNKVFELCADDGVLVTYSCKGSVRRAMIEAGFSVEKIPGPPGKREMLRATKTKDKQ